MLNMEAFRMIKPIGSKDDYEAGACGGLDRKAAGVVFVNSILASLKDKSLSVPQLSVITGRSRAAVARRLVTQLSKGVVSVKARKITGAQKPVGFYTLTGSAC